MTSSVERVLDEEIDFLAPLIRDDGKFGHTDFRIEIVLDACLEWWLVKHDAPLCSPGHWRWKKLKKRIVPEVTHWSKSNGWQCSCLEDSDA